MPPVHFVRLLCAFAMLATASACGSKYPDVPKKECSKLVSHARKLLGAQADPASKLLADCKKAEPSDRGCVKMADSAADLLRCSM